jgi:endogenous inhibitor of DNA gyrase (YacG/DUF329 family)
MAVEQTAEGLERLREEFVGEAKAAFDQMFGQDGQNGLVTFTQREDRACEATDALTRWMVQKHLVQDEAKEPGVQVECPLCGGPVQHESAQQAAMEQRELQTRRGKVEYQRAARRCPRCRKIFFSAGRTVETGDGRVQPTASGEDRIRRRQ